MSTTDFEFLKKLRTTLWQVAGMLVFAVIVATVPFYFKTLSRLESVEKEQVRIDMKKADRNVYELTIKDIKEDVKEIKADIKDLKKEQK